MKTSLPLLSFCVSIPVFAADAAQPTEEPYRLSAKTSEGCLVFNHHSCAGHRNEIRFETPNGYFISAETFSDKAHAVPLEKKYSAFGILDAHAHIDWNKQVTGKLVRLGKSFQPTDQSQLNVELYIGHLAGAADLSAIAEASIKPFTLTIPAVSYQSGNLPSIDFHGKSFSYPGQHKVFAGYQYTANGKTPFGGLRQSFGAGFEVNKQMNILVSQFAQAGVEHVGYGAGLGLSYTSSADSKIAQAASAVCQGNDIRSEARFAIAISACADKTVRDTLYDRLRHMAEPTTSRINHIVDQAQEAADQIEHKTGYGYQLPHYNSADVLRALDIESPYNHVKTSFVVAASIKLGQNHITISRIQPLHPSRDGAATTSIGLMRSF